MKVAVEYIQNEQISQDSLNKPFYGDFEAKSPNLGNFGPAPLPQVAGFRSLKNEIPPVPCYPSFQGRLPRKLPAGIARLLRTI